MDEFMSLESVPEEIRHVFTDETVALLPFIFEQAIAMLSPEHMDRLISEREGDSDEVTVEEVLHSESEIRNSFLQSVWGMLDQPPEYREDSTRAIRAMRSYEETRERRFLNEAISRLERIREQSIFETHYEQARMYLLFNIGTCYLRRYELTGDIADLDLSTSILERVVAETEEDHPLRPGRLQNLATAQLSRYERFGEVDALEEAVAKLREAVTETHSSSPYLPAYLDSLGNALRVLYAQRGDLLLLNEALGAYTEATNKAPENHPGYPGFLGNLATAYMDLFERTKDTKHFEEGLRLTEQALDLTPPESPGRSIHLLFNLGPALKTKFLYTRDPANLDRSIEVCRRVVEIAPKEPVAQADALRNLGSTLLLKFETSGGLDVIDEALELIRRSVELTPEVSFHRVLALNNLAHGLSLQYTMSGDSETREELRSTSEAACELSLDTNAALEEGLRCARSWGDWEFGWREWEEAARAYGYAERISERLVQIQVSREGKEIWLSELQGLPGRMAFALAKMGNLSRAVTSLEHGRARLLSEALDRDRADLEHLEEFGYSNLYQRYLAAVEESKALSESLSTPPEARSLESPDTSALLEALREAQRSLEAVTEEIRGVQGYESFQRSSSFEEIRSIASDSPLVYLTTTPAGSLALTVTPSGVSAEWLDLTELELDGMLIEMGPEGGPDGEPHTFPIVSGYVHAQIADPDHLKEALEELLPALGERIMAPLATHLRGIGARKMTLIPGGQLGSVPLHAASYEAEGQTICFLDEFDISYAPNARSLGVAKELLRRNQAHLRLTGVGDPQPVSEPTLQWAQFELEGIASLFEDADPLYGRAATRAALAESMQEASYIHLACHGHFSIGVPPESGLLLSNNEELKLGELLYGHVTFPKARLAVLSACQSAITASGGLPDEYIGLPIGFLQAGIPGVVGTLWPVDDYKTALLMIKFYELHLAGDCASGVEAMAPTEALCEAQRWLRRITADELLAFLDAHPAVDRGLRNKLRGDSNDPLDRIINDTAFESDTPLFFDEPAAWAPFILVGT